MAWVLAILAGLIFGAADQYLGSLEVAGNLGFWTISVSLLSAPWLVFPFVVGCTQKSVPKAAAMGLIATMSAFSGYFLMIVGPFEGGHWNLTVVEVRGLLLSNRLNIVGGVVLGPLYGFLGQRWRTRRAWLSAALVAGSLALEPLAQTVAGHSYPYETAVWTGEVLVGVLLAGAFGFLGYRHRKASGHFAARPLSTQP
jgi:hypothetical protein